jgi:ubiquinone/menaquinone biosynthesis C-methylase UbiE
VLVSYFAHQVKIINNIEVNVTNDEFFNSVADKWDEIAIHDSEKMEEILRVSKIKAGDTVIDVGTGTGTLLKLVKEKIGDNGYVVALDISDKMISCAKKKCGLEKIKYVVFDYLKYQPEESIDVIIAYSCFPHFDRKEFIKKSKSLLEEKRGKLVIAHGSSRKNVNDTHEQLQNELNTNQLPEVSVLADEMKNIGFKILSTRDDEEYYYIVAELS